MVWRVSQLARTVERSLRGQQLGMATWHTKSARDLRGPVSPTGQEKCDDRWIYVRSNSMSDHGFG